MERTRTLTLTITVDPEEEMFNVETLEPETGLTSEFGPTPFWSVWKAKLEAFLCNEVDSWIGLMMDEEDESNDSDSEST